MAASEDTRTEQERISIAIAQKTQTSSECPMCHSYGFRLAEERTVILVSSGPPPVLMHAVACPVVPCAILVCDNCGWVALHALKALGVLPEEQELEEEVKTIDTD